MVSGITRRGGSARLLKISRFLLSWVYGDNRERRERFISKYGTGILREDVSSGLALLMLESRSFVRCTGCELFELNVLEVFCDSQTSVLGPVLEGFYA